MRVGRDQGALDERAPSHVDALADVGRQRQRGVRHQRTLEVQRLERVATHERRAARVSLRRRQRRVVPERRVREVAHEALELGVARHEVRLRVDLDEAAAAIQSARRHEAVRGRARLELRRAARALLAQPLEGLLQSRRRLDGGLAVDEPCARRLAQLLDQFHRHRVTCAVRAFAGREAAEIYCAAMLPGWRDRCHLARRARVQKVSLLSGPRRAGILCGPCGEQQLLSLSE